MPVAVVVLDNLAVHRSRKVAEIFDQRFVAMFLPPYSSALNPIERLWAVAKERWRRQQHASAVALDGQDSDTVARDSYERL